MSSVRLAVTAGDVNGIGLECFIKALPYISSEVSLVLCSNTHTLHRAIIAHGLAAQVERNSLIVGQRVVPIVPIDPIVDVEPGTVDAQSGLHAVAALECAARLVREGTADGVVTLPLSKDVCARAGFTFPGQTEFFEAAAGGKAVMVLCSGTIRVALATIHVPLRRVPESLQTTGIQDVVAVFTHHLRVDRGISEPRIAILGLNPHAGEHGRLGSEEDIVIRPAIERLQIEGYTVDGPHAADGFFAFGQYQRYDGIVAMYHDQGLIPLKLLARGAGVNCTIGLPIVRTSPDHGTAFGIAGKGIADERSTVEAIQLAADISIRRSRTH